MADFFFLEQPIVDRVMAAAPELKSVTGLSSLATRPDDVIKPPMAYVLYYGYEAGDSAGMALMDGEQIITQRWLVDLIVRDIKSLTHGQTARITAGTILSKISTALRMWESRPAGVSPFVLVPAPMPEVDKDGVWSFPLLFKTSFTIV
ncbi:hypothetical protein HZB60_04160 [candidate division KSB1 bacterium]|nr:hypothetical protein [candidate division KSB1 bacterium]